MKDGPESGEGVKTAVSATNGGSGNNGDLLSPLSRDKTLSHVVAQSKQRAAAEGLVAIGAEDVVAAGDNGLPLTSLLQRTEDIEAVVPDINGDSISDPVSIINGSSNNSINDDDDDKSSNNGNKSDSGNKGSNGGGDKVFACSICNRCFGYKHVLQNHERTHTGEKPFECPECHKRFTRDHHLKTHMRLHTGEKPYQCPHCDRHFVQVANLRRHLRVHTGERPYACQACTSKFSDSNQLKAHMLIHRGEKPFQCSECLGRFRRRHHLIHHKCPKDEANLGKPRRGRRPKAYDHQLRPDDEDDSLRATDNEEDDVEHLIAPRRRIIVNNHNHTNNHHRNNNNHRSPSDIEHPPQVNSPQVLPVWNNVSATKPTCNGNSSNNRKHPNHAISILTPQQRELFLRDKVTMQTQAIDMRVSTEITPVRTVIVPTMSSRFVEGVLDLSSSRSDSEIEPIEEVEVEIQRHDDEDCLVEVDVDDEDDLVDVVNGGDNHHHIEDFDEDSCGGHHNHSVRSVVKTLATFGCTRTEQSLSPVVVANNHHLHHHHNSFNNHLLRPSVLVGKVVEPVNGNNYGSDEIRVVSNVRINRHNVSSEDDDSRQRNSLSPHPIPLTKKTSIATA